jgi:hypothetical protein
VSGGYLGGRSPDIRRGARRSSAQRYIIPRREDRKEQPFIFTHVLERIRNPRRCMAARRRRQQVNGCASLRCTFRDTLRGVPRLENVVNVKLEREDPRMHLQKGAIYRDRSNNAVRLLSICGDYCVYVYISLTNLRSSMHGSVTGVTISDVFGASFVLVAGQVKDRIGNQRKHHALTHSPGIVYSSCGSRRAQPYQDLDFPPTCSTQTIERAASHG